MTKSNRISKLLAYIVMPVIFTVLGYVLLVVALSPVLESTAATVSMLVSSNAPNFNPELKTVYDPEASKAPIRYMTETPTPVPTPTPTPLPPDVTPAPPTPTPTPRPTPRLVNGYIDSSDIHIPRAGEQYAWMSCGRIGLSAPVYWYDSYEILRYGVGQSLGSFLPGFGRLILLSGHNTTFFNCLQYIRVGDVINYYTNYCDYQYEVYDVQILDENVLGKWVTNHMLEENETLVFYCCYPFTYQATRKTDRLTVFARRIKGYDVKWKELE